MIQLTHARPKHALHAPSIVLFAHNKVMQYPCSGQTEMVFITAVVSMSLWQQFVSIDDLWGLKALVIRKVVPRRDHQQVGRRHCALRLGMGQWLSDYHTEHNIGITCLKTVCRCDGYT